MRPPVVLAYHGLMDVPRADDPTGLMLPAATFARHVRMLQRWGYAFVKQHELAERVRTGASLRGLCSITFDDGSADNHDVLVPLLDELGVPATIFACPGLLGEPYPFLPDHVGARIMTRDELLAVAAHPRVEIGAHTVNHTKLGDATFDEALAEMVACREQLEDLLGRPVPSFAYPSGDYSPGCLEAAGRAGYTSAVTTGRRGGWRPFDMQRESPDGLDGPVTFAMKVSGVFRRVRENPAARVVRGVTRPIRHRSSRTKI